MNFLTALLSSMITLSWGAVGENNSKIITYVIPTNPDHTIKSVSPCDHYIVKSYHYNCSTVTLNELVNYGYEHNNDTDSHDVIFLSGRHIVNSTQTQNLLFLGKNISALRLLGDGNVYIICEKGVSFAFLDFEEISVSNIHFKNCNGFFDRGYHNTLIFICSGHHECNVAVNKIEIVITNANDGGIAIIFANQEKNYFVLANSRISTEGIGVNISTARHSYQVSDIVVSSVSFHLSCFMIYRGALNVNYRILNVIFTGCSCSSISVYAPVRIIMNNVTVSDTKSQYLVYSNMNGGYITLQGQCLFSNNRGAILATGSHSITFSKSKVKFINNKIGKSFETLSAVIVAVSTRVTFDSSHVMFKNNYGTNCGGIAATSSAKIVFTNSKITFSGNHGELQGGAMSFYSMSVLILNDYTELNASSITFSNNRASKAGGALFIDDNSYVRNKKLQKSIFDFHCITDKVRVSKIFEFSNNTAQFGGNDIYGGWVDWFMDKNLDIKPRISTHILYFEDDMFGIASDPTRVCICINHSPNCSITAWEFEIYPGQTVVLDAVAVGQRFGTVATRVKANIEMHLNESQQTGRSIKKSEIIQSVKRNCTALKYTIMTPNKIERLSTSPLKWKKNLIFEQQVLRNYPDNLGLLFKQFSIKFFLKTCSIGFLMDKTAYKCICSPTLVSYGYSCNLTTYVYMFPKSVRRWTGITEVHTSVDKSPGVIVYHSCPFDYCRSDLSSTPINFEHQDEQCAFNRSGILCGGCQTNFSRVLGSSKCKKCSSIMVLAILPSIALAGLLLVILLMVLNLTVSVGTINGLIFYANIIQIQHATFFTSESANSFLSVFIAWLNLDFGIESCFYDGFNAYTETWLQFCFPLYIWLIALVIILPSHYSTRVSKLYSKNAVPVLATLILLSYTKLLRLAVDVFSFAIITYPDGYVRAVWLYDGNVDYLKGKHIPLFIVTLSLIVLSVPYTLSLVSIQWLFKISHYRSMFWVQRLKPFFDAYTGPYKANHRYWTGLLLIIRIVLPIVLSVINQNTVSLYIIIVLSCVLQMWLYFTRWVYERFLNNCLEMIFLFNLGLTSTMLLRYRQVPTYISTGLAFVMFIGIILYHALMRLNSTRVGAKLKKLTFFHLKLDEKLLQLQISECDDEIESDYFSRQAEIDS